MRFRATPAVHQSMTIKIKPMIRQTIRIILCKSISIMAPIIPMISVSSAITPNTIETMAHP